MAINLELPRKLQAVMVKTHQGAAELMRPIARKYDLKEHAYPVELDTLFSLFEGASESIEFADISLVGANPARIIPAWRDFVDKHADSGSRMRGIGEPRSRRRCQRTPAVRAHRAIRPQERPLQEQGQRGSGPHRDEGAPGQGPQQRPLTEPPSRAGR